MLMKRVKVLLLYLFVSAQLFAQGNGGEISQQIPFELQARIGFMFGYALLGLLFLMLVAFYPRQRLNLFLGLFNLWLFLMLLNLQSFTGEPSALKTEINDFLARLTGVSSLLFIVYALNRMRPFFWWLVAFVLLI